MDVKLCKMPLTWETLVADSFDGRVCNFLPTAILVRVGVLFTHRQASIQKKDTLVSPTCASLGKKWIKVHLKIFLGVRDSAYLPAHLHSGFWSISLPIEKIALTLKSTFTL